jgi:hypothetical protein
MKRTKQAIAYVKMERRTGPDDPTWFDIARAYDAGLRSGVEARRIAIRQLEEAASPVSESE